MSSALNWLEQVWSELNTAPDNFKATKGYYDSRLGCVRARYAIEKGQPIDPEDDGEPMPPDV